MRRRLIYMPAMIVAAAITTRPSGEVAPFTARPVIGSTDADIGTRIAGAETAGATAARGAWGPTSTCCAAGGAGCSAATAATGATVFVAAGLAVIVAAGATGVAVLTGVSEGSGSRGPAVFVGGTGVLVLIAVRVLVGT